MKSQIFLKKHYSKEQGSLSFSAPSNIAVMKYWGKYPGQIPMNPSLSFSLSEARTTCRLDYSPSDNRESFDDLEFFFEGKENVVFKQKILKFLRGHEEHFSRLKPYKLSFESQNTFPHSAGIASSASSMAALNLVLHALMAVTKDQNTLDINEVSSYSRLASGSACRSLYSGWSFWGESSFLEGSDNTFAVGIKESDIGDDFKTIHDYIFLIDREKKSVSSSQGHALMEGHPYQESRKNWVEESLTPDFLASLKTNDFSRFGSLLEREALSLHGLMMSSDPSFILMKPLTLEFISLLRDFRANKKCDLYFTLDAGPNPHLLFPERDLEKANEFVALWGKSECLKDKIGGGIREE